MPVSRMDALDAELMLSFYEAAAAASS